MILPEARLMELIDLSPTVRQHRSRLQKLSGLSEAESPDLAPNWA